MAKTLKRDIKEISFSELFEGSFYSIPLYQRGYSWDKQNLTTLWEDIENIRDASDSEAGPGSHFMSSILVRDGHDSNGAKHIVDGQQRITTIFLLFKAAIDILSGSKYSEAELGASFRAELYDLLYGKNYKSSASLSLEGPVSESFGFSNPRLTLQSQPDDHAFNVLIYKGAPAWAGTHKKSKVYISYTFFASKLKILLNSDNPMQFFKTVRVAMDKLQMIYIPILESEAPQKIFESVNGLTKKLYAGELIKNYLLMSMTTDEDSNRVYQKYWAEFDKPEWTETDKKKDHFTRMLYYWVLSNGIKDMRATDELIYRTSKKVIDLSSLPAPTAAQKAEKASASIYNSVMTLRNLGESKNHPTTRIEKSYNRIFSIKDTVSCKAVFILFVQIINELEKHYGKKMSEKQLDKLLLPLESYVIRKSLSAYGYSGRTTEHLVDLTRSVFIPLSAEEHETLDEFLEDKVLKLAKEMANGLEQNRRFDSTASLFSYLTGSIENGLMPKQFSQNYHEMIRMLLLQVENHLSSNVFKPKGTIFSGEEQSLEHWLPQKSSPLDWPLQDEKDRESYTHALGNLCIIPQTINSSLSNQSLEKKMEKVRSLVRRTEGKTGIQTFDKMLELCSGEDKDVWDEQSIEDRAKWITDILLNKIFKDIEFFTGEERPFVESEKDTLWQVPVAGRRIKAVSRQTIVRAYQLGDGTLVIDEVIGMQPNCNPSLIEGHRKKREQILKDSVRQEDGTYDWQGNLHSQNKTGFLSVMIGSPSSNIWTIED